LTYIFLNIDIQIIDGEVMAHGMEEPSLFLKFFGNTPKLRIIDFLIDNRLQNFTKSEIAKGAKISWASLFNHWKELEVDGIVKVVRTVGRVKLYQLDERAPVVQQLMGIDLALIKKAADEAEEEASLKVKARAGTKK
jgi:DNA-binding transcriptional ArsR family regulator